jgi:hypothetical protein
VSENDGRVRTGYAARVRAVYATGYGPVYGTVLENNDRLQTGYATGYGARVRAAYARPLGSDEVNAGVFVVSRVHGHNPQQAGILAVHSHTLGLGLAANGFEVHYGSCN